MRWSTNGRRQVIYKTIENLQRGKSGDRGFILTENRTMGMEQAVAAIMK
ncbi:MAG TPA: hypothetical protein VHY56_10485 [Candidatus Binataceae bacterium]|nr:hypothetical protein [Candidatus Binataceae bacterium]